MLLRIFIINDLISHTRIISYFHNTFYIIILNHCLCYKWLHKRAGVIRFHSKIIFDVELCAKTTYIYISRFWHWFGLQWKALHFGFSILCSSQYKFEIYLKWKSKAMSSHINMCNMYNRKFLFSQNKHWNKNHIRYIYMKMALGAIQTSYTYWVNLIQCQ